MTEEEKKAIIELNHYSNMTAYWKQEEYTNSEIDNYIKILLNLIQKQESEINKLKEENESLKYACEKATEIIKEYANETEMDTKKLIEYQEKYLNNKEEVL